MALTGKEMAAFKRLQAKAVEPCVALTDGELCEIEENIAAAYDLMPDLMVEMMGPWNLFCARLKLLANDNARLVSEIRRLKTPNVQGNRPARLFAQVRLTAGLGHSSFLAPRQMLPACEARYG